ncbi:MAG TPA: DUF1259 domain-containing protein [Gemmatimonadaceae bacterium]|nr:DUF1259 domain-containing protein [Gemmatimonadaceae bacterium]
MNVKALKFGIFVLAAGASPFSQIANAQSAAARQSARYWAPVEVALGRKGTASPGGVMRFSFPRSDLTVVANGVTLKPAFALGSWIAFQRMRDHAMVMGDIVLLESEVTEVLASLQQNGIEQTALHNHLIGESPRVMYMHIRAIGNAERIARAVRTALEFSNTPLAAPAASPATVSDVPPALDTAAIATALHVRGKLNGGVYQLSIPRREKIKEDKVEIPPAMGVATAINFQSTGATKAAITGDFVLLRRELNSVIWSLTEKGIEVTAIHSHMTGEEPRLFFLHFWANDDAVKLARGLRAALDQTGRQ